MKEAAMNRHRNHVGQLGRLTVCDTRSGATRVHGGEHLAALLLGWAALAPNDIPFDLRVKPFTLDNVTQLFGDPLD